MSNREEPTHEPELRTRPYAGADDAVVVPMYEIVFGRARTKEEIDHRLLRGPGGPASRRVLVADDQVIGHMALLPLPAWVERRRAIVPLGLDSMVLPEWRGKGLIALLARSILDAVPDADFGISFTTDRPLRAFERLAETVSEERLTQWVRWHDLEHLQRSAGRNVPSALRPVARAGVRALRALGSVPARGVRIEAGRPLGHELDALALASASFAPMIHLRDARYLDWRWPEADETWTVHSARTRRGRLLGWAVSGIDAHRSPGTGVIGDILAATPLATAALISRAAGDLAARGAGVVTMAYRDPRRWSAWSPAAAGFVRRGVAPPILPFPLSPDGVALLTVSGWYLTGGGLV